MNTAKFPTATVAEADVLTAKDNSISTLTGDINNSVTSIPVASGAQFVAKEVVAIDSELVLIDSVVGNTLTNCTRGFLGTSAASHSNGAYVRGNVTAYHHNQLAAEVKAIEDALGANLGNVTKNPASGVEIRGAAGAFRSVDFYTNTSQRWTITADNTAESGSNVGSVFKIGRYNDAGAWQDFPITIDRATGVVTINLPLLTNVPTSSSGLASGRIWRDAANGNVLKMVP